MRSLHAIEDLGKDNGRSRFLESLHRIHHILSAVYGSELLREKAWEMWMRLFSLRETALAKLVGQMWHR